MTKQPLLTLPEAAQRLAVSERKLRDMVAKGYLPKVKIGIEVRFDPEDVEAYITSHKISKGA